MFLCRFRQVQFNHRHALLEKIREEEDVPTAFHQAIVLLFGAVFQTMLHCTGKMIPQLVKQLEAVLSEDNCQLITSCQGKVSWVTQLGYCIADQSSDFLSFPLFQYGKIIRTEGYNYN